MTYSFSKLISKGMNYSMNTQPIKSNFHKFVDDLWSDPNFRWAIMKRTFNSLTNSSTGPTPSTNHGNNLVSSSSGLVAITGDGTKASPESNPGLGENPLPCSGLSPISGSDSSPGALSGSGGNNDSS